MDASAPEVRALFDRETVLKSDWYAARLDKFLDLQKALYERHRHALKAFLASPLHSEESHRLGTAATLAGVEAHLKTLGTKEYRQGLVGTLGADLLYRN
jgi:hypothetical protein